MTQAVHATIVVERHYPAKPERVFAAWSDPKQRAQWDIPEEGWIVAEQHQDFTVGGEEFARFGPKENPEFVAKGQYLDIVPDQRIVSAGTMHFGETRASSTLCTVELAPKDGGTYLKLTDQSVFYGGETPADRTAGWNPCADTLGAFLQR